MTDVYLGLGSNISDRADYLRRALDAIAALPGTRLVTESPIYETPPMGPQDQDAYLNMAAKIETDLQPESLIQKLQAIELDLGRPEADQRQHWGPRQIDIDLLLYADRVIDRPGLTVPHPGMHQRWFVLKPLSDIAAQVQHPSLGRTIAELLADAEQNAIQETSP